MAGRQAKVLNKLQPEVVLSWLASNSRNPERDRTMFMLSCKAGLRAAEIAQLRWSMVSDSEGYVADAIELPDAIAKKRSGRTIPMGKQLRKELDTLRRKMRPTPDEPVVYSERGGYAAGEEGGRPKLKPMSPHSVVKWFGRLYVTMGFEGCSSHSGRRTFITMAAREIVSVGGSLRDVQQLAGHRDLKTTQGYIEGSSDAKRKVVDRI